MVRQVITTFNGAIPRATEYALPENVAVFATDCKLNSGEVRGRHSLSLMRVLVNPAARFAVRIPDPPNADVWMEFSSPDTVVIRSPVTNDSFDRYYWHEPGLPLRYNTFARIKAGNPPFLLGVPQPASTVSVVGSGGSGTQVERAYTYTFVSAYGEEGPPANPTQVHTWFDDGTWTIAAMDLTVPDAADRNITHKNIYRTVTSATGNADFYFVAQIPLAQASYADTIKDLDVASLGRALPSTFWTPPPSDMQGIVSFPGGIVLGWKDDTVFMSVPYRPHAWPTSFQVAVQQPIVGIGVTGNTAVIGTQGPPHALTMTTPDVASLQKIQAPEPCLSRASVIGSPEGVFYASQNGLMLYGQQGFVNASRNLMTKEEWLSNFRPQMLRACRYQTDYIGIVSSNSGYVINAEVEPMTLVEISNLANMSNIFNDVWTGEVYLLMGGKVWKWDDPLTNEVIWRWCSKRFFMLQEVNFGAARIGTKLHHYTPLEPPPVGAELGVVTLPGTGSDGAAAATDPQFNMNLPNHAHFQLRVYADGKKVFTRDVIGPGTIKLPSGFKSQDWQFEIIGRIPMAKFEFAETAKELSQV